MSLCTCVEDDYRCEWCTLRLRLAEVANERDEARAEVVKLQTALIELTTKWCLDETRSEVEKLKAHLAESDKAMDALLHDHDTEIKSRELQLREWYAKLQAADAEVAALREGGEDLLEAFREQCAVAVEQYECGHDPDECVCGGIARAVRAVPLERP